VAGLVPSLSWLRSRDTVLRGMCITANRGGTTFYPATSYSKRGGQQNHLPTGGSIWLPRDLPHCWANEGTTTGKLILMCQPAGFEGFFDEAEQLPLYSQDPAELQKLHELHAKYGMELVGPPILRQPRAAALARDGVSHMCRCQLFHLLPAIQQLSFIPENGSPVKLRRSLFQRVSGLGNRDGSP
jgi:hypothetical protein